MNILVLNSGSSSQKCALDRIADSIPDQPLTPLWQGTVEWSERQPKLVLNAQGASFSTFIPMESRAQALERLLHALSYGEMKVISSLSEVALVGHRFVHGGSEFRAATRITASVQESLRGLAVFAPLHNRAELEAVEIIGRHLGEVPQIAVFDTAFHSQMPAASYVYPGPYDWLEHGIRRYGFHGINHQYCSERAAQVLDRNLCSLRIVTCHLGSGCSLAAIRDGHSVDTTMGFTPLEGLMMGTRSGSIDPGIVTYLMRQQHSPEELDEILNTKSGLLGISGISGDMREIVSAMRKGHDRARLAFEIFVHRLRREIGAMISVLGGIDALVFTAGIGENSAEVRAASCEGLAYIGIKLDDQKNSPSAEDRDISASDSAIRVLVVRAQEEWVIARECWRAVGAHSIHRASAPTS